jgi:hypothetical protein
MLAPFTNEEAGEARKSTAAATSAGVPTRAAGTRAITSSANSRQSSSTAFEAGPEGLEIIVIAAPNLGEAPREDVEGQCDWWAD